MRPDRRQEPLRIIRRLAPNDGLYPRSPGKGENGYACLPVGVTDHFRHGEQADYDVAHWSIRSTSGDALQIADDWIYAIAHVEGNKTAHADGAKSSSRPPRRGSYNDKKPANG